ncbi:unnamed protein product [Rotaria sp. Silwood1]|nr:unnamed protein product [Rotaria sp. Silwood1]
MGVFQTIGFDVPKAIMDYFDLYGSTMQRVLTDRNFLSDWTRETIEKVDNYFRSKYSVGENGSRINDKKLWSDEYLLHLTKYK